MEARRLKIALCVPCHGDTKGKFTQSLANMLIHFYSANFTTPDGTPIERELEVFMVSCSMLTEGRHKLVAEALSWGADWMLWLDADHTFPSDTLARLWSHNLPVVGCNYARRCFPTAPTAARQGCEGGGKKSLVYTTQEKAEAREVEEVDHLGFGVCLIDMRVFDVLQNQAEAEGNGNFLPLFKFETAPNGIGVIGEDVYFFKKLRAAGIPVHVDHALSWEVGHLHEMPIFLSAANNQRERWESDQEKARDKYEQRATALEAQEA